MDGINVQEANWSVQQVSYSIYDGVAIQAVNIRTPRSCHVLLLTVVVSESLDIWLKLPQIIQGCTF